MALYFLTGNEGKYREAKTVIPELERMVADLDEIQELDARMVISHKLTEAMAKMEGELVVEDTSLGLSCLSGFPGTLVKWLAKAIENQGIVNLTQKYGDDQAEARVILGYADAEREIRFFDGVVKGRIVLPRGGNGFGWDEIFQPEGFEKTFAEMDEFEKNSISMRKQAFQKLKNYLDGLKSSP